MKRTTKNNLRVILGMAIGTIIYCMGVVWLLDLGEFYAGGVTGFSQIISKALSGLGINIPKSIFIALLNIPLFIIGYKGVSKRFAILSLSSVILQVVTIATLEYFVSIGFSPFANSFLDPSSNQLDAGSRLTLALLGGLVCGVGSGIGLRSGASTGGMDILAQYFSFKKKVPFTTISLSVDLVIIILAAFVGTIETAVYTIIRLIITVLVLDKIHTIYKYMRVQIVTTKKEEMCEALISNFNHGVTIFHAIGGFSGTDKWVLESVVSSYEAEEYKNLALKIDSSSFITFTIVKQVYGLFNRNVIT